MNSSMVWAHLKRPLYGGLSAATIVGSRIVATRDVECTPVIVPPIEFSFLVLIGMAVGLAVNAVQLLAGKPVLNSRASIHEILWASAFLMACSGAVAGSWLSKSSDALAVPFLALPLVRGVMTVFRWAERMSEEEAATR